MNSGGLQICANRFIMPNFDQTQLVQGFGLWGAFQVRNLCFTPFVKKKKKD